MRGLALLHLLCLAGVGLAQTDPVIQPPGAIDVGSIAPKLTVGSWVQGEPVTLEKGKIQIVEFWATWCGPCRTSVPHVNELAQKYKGKVAVVGVSVWEQAPDIPAAVQKFIKEMNGQMSYSIALDTEDNAMSRTWMEAAGESGIPTAFIIKDQQILWIGHPLSMDKPLEDIVNNTFDLEAFKKERASVKVEREALEKARYLMEQAQKEYEYGDKGKAILILDGLAKTNPQMGVHARMLKLELLSTDNVEAAKKEITTLAATGELGNLMSLTIYAMGMAESGKKELSLYTTQKVLEGMKKDDAVLLYYAGVTYSSLEDYKSAALVLQKAVKAYETSTYKDDPAMVGFKQDLEKALITAKEKSKGGG